MLLSIKQYIILFVIITAILTSIFVYKIETSFSKNKEIILESKTKSANDELQQAINLTLKSVKNSSSELSNWQEVKQQINNPEVFDYWYSVRFKNYSFDLKKYTRDFIIYNKNGTALRKINNNLPQQITTDNLVDYTFKVANKNEIISIEPVYENSTIIGYISIRVDLISILVKTIHFQYISPETLSINSKNENLISTLDNSDFFYKLHESKNLEILEKQISDTLIELVIFILFPIIILFIIIIFLIVRPIEEVALYIDKLRESANYNNKKQPSQTRVKEIEKIYKSLKDYHRDLSENEEYLSLTLNSIGDAVITTDDMYRIVHMNPVAASLTGWSFNEAKNKNINEILEFVSVNTREPIINIFAEVIEHRKVIHIDNDTLLISKDKDEYHISDSAAPILDGEGNIRGLVIVFNDITEQKTKEEQLQQSQKMDALGNLTGGIAHDYNNMLGIILGYADLLNDSTKTDLRSHKYVKEIIKAGERSRKLTSKLLTFSRKGSHESSVTDINELIMSEKDMLEKLLTVRINLTLELEKDLWPVYLDNNQLQDSILNICINAMHAMPNGGKLTIKTHNIHFDSIESTQLKLNRGDYVQLSIADTGTGMSNEICRKIFEPFFSTKGDKGTGLGLSQVYGYINQSGGAVHVYSEPDVGTKISLYIPRHIQNDAAHLDIEAEPSIKKLQGNETILVVDDELSLLELTCQILSSYGYNTMQANTAKKALKILEDKQIDLLITDIIMPEMDGYELSKLALEKHPDLKIQLISGFNIEPDESIINTNLYKQQLSKPYSKHELLSKIRNLLDH
ncbi:MAG: response regulator [Gammaproteobacteria bacterium]|nr:response regulator [Gammaproteobacteria bacterium]